MIGMFRRGCDVTRRVRWLQGRAKGKGEGLAHTGGQEEARERVSYQGQQDWG